MKRSTTLSLVSLLCALPLAIACGSDDDDKPGGSTGGTGGTAGSAGSGGSSGGATGGGAGSGGAGGTPSCDLSGTGLPKEKIPNKISTDTTLTQGQGLDARRHHLRRKRRHADHRALHSHRGQKDAPGHVGRVLGEARSWRDGKANEPILFTSALPAGSRSPGDWGGIIVLGKAPNFKGENVTIEGLADAPENQYGGSVADDDSGVMRYMRHRVFGFRAVRGQRDQRPDPR